MLNQKHIFHNKMSTKTLFEEKLLILRPSKVI